MPIQSRSEASVKRQFTVWEGKPSRTPSDRQCPSEQRVEAVRRGEPHRVVGGFVRSRLRSSRPGHRSGSVVGEAAVREFTYTAAESAGPNRAIMALKNRVDTVLREAVRFGVGPGCERAGGIMQMRQPALLPADPQIFFCPRQWNRQRPRLRRSLGTLPLFSPFNQ